jgi:hypothetical protein
MTTPEMLTNEELRESMLATGNRLLEAQRRELRLLTEEEIRPGMPEEIRQARAAVDALLSDYLESIRQYRAMTSDTPEITNLRKIVASGFHVALQLPWRRRLQPTDRLERLCRQ